MKPLLACDLVESKVVFPIGVQPKIDGVRGLTTEGGLTGRSLKKHKNIYTTKFYSSPEYANMDGELAALDEKSETLCRATSSALSTIEGSPFTLWHVFDMLTPLLSKSPYGDRYEYLQRHILSQQSRGLCQHARVVPMVICKDIASLRAQHERNLEQGYEGTITRNLSALHKSGRSGLRGELWRIKDFIETEGTVVQLTEGMDNNNEPQLNELGRTFRTSHLAGKTMSEMVGNMQVCLLSDVVYQGKAILTKGQTVTVSPGTMDHEMRRHYWVNQSDLVSKVVKFKFFPKGIKDKPRFPTYQAHRSAEDMS